MFRNQYDDDATTWSPQGRLFQVEYAIEAVKLGSCSVAIKGKVFFSFLPSSHSFIVGLLVILMPTILSLISLRNLFNRFRICHKLSCIYKSFFLLILLVSCIVFL